MFAASRKTNGTISARVTARTFSLRRSPRRRTYTRTTASPASPMNAGMAQRKRGPSDHAAKTKRITASAPPALNHSIRHASSSTIATMPTRARFCMAMCTTSFVVIFWSTYTTATGTKRLSVPRSDTASKIVTSIATSKAERMQTAGGRSDISSAGSTIARNAISMKTTDPSTLLYSSSTS